MANNDRLFIVVVLGLFMVVGGVLAAYEHNMDRQAERMQAEWADEQILAERAAERTQAQASQEAMIAEGQLVSAHIAELKEIRSEFGKTMDSLRDKAKSSASASRQWDRLWAKRRARYTSRYEVVTAHNSRERQLDQAGYAETANSAGTLVVRDTYTPQYWEYPASPEEPAPLKVSVNSEIRRLTTLQKRVGALRSSVASETRAARFFGPVYEVLADTAQAFEAMVDDANALPRKVVVTKAAKGQVINASRILKVDEPALDAPFAELDLSFSDALTAVGLSPEDVAAEGADAQ